MDFIDGNFSDLPDMIFSILSSLIWPFIVIAIIYKLFHRRNSVQLSTLDNPNWFMRLSFSKEDFVSQAFLLFFVLFLGLTLSAFNRELNSPLSWVTLLLITSVVGFIVAYYFKSLYTLTISVIGIISWWIIKASGWIGVMMFGLHQVKVMTLFSCLGFIALLLYTIGRFHEKELKFKRFALVYLLFGIAGTTAFLFGLSTKIGLSVFAEMSKGTIIFSTWQMLTSYIVFSLALAILISYLFYIRMISIYEALSLFFLEFLFVILTFIPTQHLTLEDNMYQAMSNGLDLSATGMAWALFFNILVFIEVLGIIFSGYLKKEEWLINLGAVFLFILIFVKYFDWFFSFLDKSIFFIGAGLIFFGVGWFMEKGRRRMIATIKSG